MSEEIWYYEKHNIRQGPVSEDTLLQLIAGGQLKEDTFVWSPPMQHWTPASSVNELKTKFIPEPTPLLTTKRLWYYFKHFTQHGPVSENELLQLIANGDIEGDTAVWTQPMEEWARASTINELRKNFPPAPLPPEQIAFRSPVPVESTNYEQPLVIPVMKGVSQVQPFSRFVARMIDYVPPLIIIEIFKETLFPDLTSTQELTFDLIRWPLAGVLVLLTEPFFLSRYGRTLGKYMLGISVRRNDGSLLSSEEADDRAYNAWKNGLAFNIFIISWLVMMAQYMNLKFESITSWDRKGGYVVFHRSQNKIFRYLLIFALLSVTFLIMVRLALWILGIDDK